MQTVWRRHLHRDKQRTQLYTTSTTSDRCTTRYHKSYHALKTASKNKNLRLSLKKQYTHTLSNRPTLPEFLNVGPNKKRFGTVWWVPFLHSINTVNVPREPKKPNCYGKRLCQTAEAVSCNTDFLLKDRIVGEAYFFTAEKLTWQWPYGGNAVGCSSPANAVIDFFAKHSAAVTHNAFSMDRTTQKITPSLGELDPI